MKTMMCSEEMSAADLSDLLAGETDEEEDVVLTEGNLVFFL